MSEASLYRIVFSGRLVKGAQLDVVKQQAVQLFKMNASQIEPLFSGQLVVLKKNINAATAKKYQHIIAKSGMLVEIQAQQKTEEKTLATETSASPLTRSSSYGEWQVDQPGVILSNGEKNQSVTALAAPHFTLANQPGYILRDDEKPSTPEALDIAPLGSITIQPVGESLLLDAEKAEHEQGMVLNTDYLSTTEVGQDLLKPDEKPITSSVTIDTSSLSLE